MLVWLKNPRLVWGNLRSCTEKVSNFWEQNLKIVVKNPKRGEKNLKSVRRKIHKLVGVKRASLLEGKITKFVDEKSQTCVRKSPKSIIKSQKSQVCVKGTVTKLQRKIHKV